MKLAIKPQEIRIRLRSGGGRPLASATVNGKPAPVQSGDFLPLPVETDGTYKILGHFE